MMSQVEQYKALDKVAMDADTIWKGENAEIDALVQSLIAEGLAEWAEEGYGEANPALTEKGYDLWEQLEDTYR